MLTKNQKQNQFGFSVIEVLITLFVIAVALTLFQATANSVVLNKYARFREIALRIADQKIQTVRSTPFSSIPASGSFADSALSSIPNGQGTLTVTNTSATLKDVVVTVTWTRPDGGDTQQVQLQTYVTSGGLGQ